MDILEVALGRPPEMRVRLMDRGVQRSAGFLHQLGEAGLQSPPWAASSSDLK